MIWRLIHLIGNIQDIKKESWVLTDEGKTYAATGSPEVQLFLAIPPEGITKEELQVCPVNELIVGSILIIVYVE